MENDNKKFSKKKIIDFITDTTKKEYFGIIDVLRNNGFSCGNREKFETGFFSNPLTKESVQLIASPEKIFLRKNLGEKKEVKEEIINNLDTELAISYLDTIFADGFLEK